eukprot:CAMPEP_0113523916 /NCGR_PEP_ID=MMETSP0014_2-20120614/45946_1 /TAXON_ID=2857 /ORGANISM="Nitzschia sp." /LENGTH=150 /DNA_ID=CAMNT_0000422009 /DNA_START=136 /DNA_END=585 /DNA_ORIENTATION=+ /assembly_acc=CAM_ASM_000159
MRLSLAAVSVISTATATDTAATATTAATTAKVETPQKADRLLKQILSSSSQHKDIRKKNKSRNSHGVLDAIRRRHLQRNRQKRVLRNLPIDQDEEGHDDHQKHQTRLCLVDSSKEYTRIDKEDGNASSSSTSSFLGILSCGQNQYCMDAG